MSKQINFFLFLAIMTVFAACNNANKPAETVKEKSQEAPTMSAKELAMSDAQEKMDKKSVLAKKETSVANNKAAQDLTPGKIKERAKASTAPMSDADKLRQIAAAQQATRPNTGSNLSNTTPTTNKVENTASKKKATIKTKKVATPTLNTPTQEVVEQVAAAPNHDDWNTLLTQNVSSTGKVNYKGFKSAQSKLNAYLDKLKSNPPVATWSRNEKMAYWINAYNAFTVKKIVDNYPLGSIQELSGGKVWDDKWINIGTKTYSLNEIENGILRPTYNDARIHFAVNCAAKSCPSLHNRAFTAGNLESKLAQLTKKFVNNTDFNTITASKVTVSKIFDWYGSDFGDLKEFLNQYSNTPINADAAIDYTEYNWSLNE